MTIEFRCPDCSRLLRTADHHAGVLAKCPQCGRELTVPPASTDAPGAGEPPLPAAEGSAGETNAMVGQVAEAPAGTTPRPNVPLVPCPMCGAAIAPRAVQCPHCGESLQGAGRLGSQVFRLGFVLERAWNIFKRDMGTAMAVFWLSQLVRFGAYFAIAMAITLAMPMLGLGVGNAGVGPMGFRPPIGAFMLTQAVQTFLFSIILSVISSLIMPGCARCMLALVRGGPVDIADIFRSGPCLLRYIGNDLVIHGVNFVVAVAVSFPASWYLLGAMQNGFANAREVSLAVGLALLGMVLQVIVQMLTWPWYYVLVDADPPGLGSLSQAMGLTRRHLFGMFLLMLLNFLLAFGGIVAVCIGLLFMMPFTMVVFTVAYCELAGQRTSEG